MKHLSYFLVPIVLVALALASGSAAPVQDPADPTSRPGYFESPGIVPVGTVLMWWGIEAELPAGYETCDGKFPVTKGATLKERKPDLRDRFMKGAKDFSTFRPQTAASGGTNGRGDIMTEPHVMTQSELPDLPKHTHPIAHTHNVPEHAHRIGTHEHPIGPLVTITYADDGTHSATFLNPQASGTQVNSDPALPGSMTGQSLAFATSAPSLPNSGENPPKNVTPVGHVHTIHFGDSMPAFLEMIFIIRVR